MSDFESALSERVEKRYKEWEQKFEIPELYEFQVRALIELQEEYKEVSKTERGHTKTRESLLHMIGRLQSGLRLEKKKKEKEIKTKIYIACNEPQLSIVSHLMSQLFNKDKIIHMTQMRNLTKVLTTEYEIVAEKFTEDGIRGKKADIYFNLTGDSSVEEVLQKVFRR